MDRVVVISGCVMKHLISICAGFALIVFASGAQAAILTFDDIPYMSSDWTYTESGYLFDEANGDLGGGGAENLHIDIFSGPFANKLRLTATDGSLFSLSAIDIAPMGVSFVSGAPMDDAEFIGMREGDVVASLMASSQSGASTITFGRGFGSIDSLMIKGVWTGNLCGDEGLRMCGFDNPFDVHFTLDNIVLGLPAPVPIPGSAASLLGAIVFLVALRRYTRRTGSARQS